VSSIEKVSSERPVYGLSEQGKEALHFLAPFGEIDRAVSYGVFFCVPEPIDGAQPLNCVGITGTRAIDRGPVRPLWRQRAPKQRQSGLLLRFVGGSKSGRFNSFGQSQCAGRTVGDGSRRCDLGGPDLQADLDGRNYGECGNEQRKYRDADGPTELSSSV
jgi:hypothetical protein